jgi:hypothetical protein
MSARAARCGRVGPRVLPMKPTDTLPALVSLFVEQGSHSAELLSEFMRHVATVARPYPAAYFALSDKSDVSVDDLGNRAFTSCARVCKGRFPFEGRTPFGAFVEEAMDGRTIRYHSFYSKLAITREILRDDYAHNIRRDPVLRWRAELYTEIGAVLKVEAVEQPQGRGVPPKWALESTGLRAMQPLSVIEGRLRSADDQSVAGLVRKALHLTVSMSQSQLTNLLASVLPPPATELPVQTSPAEAMAERMDIRGAVARAWEALDVLDQTLIIALARGDSYEDLIARDPRLKHKVAVSRAVSRVGKLFLAEVVDQMGLDTSTDMTPRTLMEPIIAVLHSLYPHRFDGAST